MIDTESERELCSGILSKTTRFRLIVTGDIGVIEIELLIRMLRLIQEALGDTRARDRE
jgi:hypothetical protein